MNHKFTVGDIVQHNKEFAKCVPNSYRKNEKFKIIKRYLTDDNLDICKLEKIDSKLDEHEARAINCAWLEKAPLDDNNENNIHTNEMSAEGETNGEMSYTF